MSTTPDPRTERLPVLRSAPPWAVDAALVVLIVAVSALSSGDHEGGGSGRIISAALALPLLLRRRAPVGVFAAVSLIALGQWAWGDRAPGDVALLVALYTVATTQPLRRTLLAAGALEVGIALAVARWGHHNWLYAFIALSGLATAAGVLGTNVRHRRALFAFLEERAEQLEHERDQQGRLAAAAERSRIAREMHDIVAHNLSVMIALADGAGYALRDAPERAEAAMHTASQTGRQALTEMRRLLGVLRDEPGLQALAPQPDLAAIDALVAQVRAAGLPVAYEVTGAARPEIPAGLELAAYRIVQEALTNTLKHAGAGAEARVRLAFEPAELEIEVLDTGVPSPGLGGEGGGLRGMRERAAVYGGAVDAGPRPEGGWRVHTRLAYAAEAAALSPLPA